ncbi:hypothetical protein [Micrococcus sp.]|uniref:hypothetical protein n=1 Tax=Micrococcus sp. TaxID=1271 RepID=UPI002A912AF1|nr:hypothetical protein [Micrococcus sp.]MDY6054929.1 hypothetical protein [Micrococcus sp.]
MSGPAPIRFTTSGGSGSIHADLDSLAEVAGRHGEAAEKLLHLAAQVETVVRHLGSAPRVSGRAAQLEGRLWEGRDACRALQERLLDMQRTLKDAIERYRLAEQGAAGVMDEEELALWDLPARLEEDSADGLTVPEGERLLRALNGASISRGAAERLAAVLDVTLLAPELPGVGPGAPGTPTHLDGGPGDLASLIPDASLPPGTITLTQVTTASGEDVWVVGLPGTQASSALVDPDGGWSDPMGIADALGRGSEHTGEGIARALTLGGVPEGEPVVFVGYSQGGLHALNMPSHPLVSERWDVAGVVTFASPGGGILTPAGVPVMAFQREVDLVTALDGGPEPATVWRATVTFQPESGAAPEGYTGPGLPGFSDVFGPEHALPRYLEQVRAYEAAPPELKVQEQGQLAALSALTAGTVRSSATVRLRRWATGDPAPQSRPRAPHGPGR